MLNQAKPYNSLKRFPISLTYDKRWNKFFAADIMKLDIERVNLLDYLIGNIKNIQISINEKNVTNALIYIMHNMTLSKAMRDNYMIIYHARIFSAILIKEERIEEGLKALEFIRDMSEETYNYDFLMETYL